MEYEEELERITEERTREKEKVVAEIKNSIQEGIKEEMEKRKSYVGARIKQGKVTELKYALFVERRDV